jgi:hypothetical protein
MDGFGYVPKVTSQIKTHAVKPSETAFWSENILACVVELRPVCVACDKLRLVQARAPRGRNPTRQKDSEPWTPALDCPGLGLLEAGGRQGAQTFPLLIFQIGKFCTFHLRVPLSRNRPNTNTNFIYTNKTAPTSAINSKYRSCFSFECSLDFLSGSTDSALAGSSQDPLL